MKAIQTIALGTWLLLSLPLMATSPTPTSPEALIKEGRINDALSVLERRLSASESDADAHHLLSRAYLAVEDWDRAIKEGERAVALAPERADFHLWLGRAYGRKAEHCNPFCGFSNAKKSRAEFERALQLDANDVMARTDLAEFLLEAPGIVGGGKDKAKREAETLSLKDAAAAHWVLARLAEKDEDFAAAESEYKAAIKESNNHPGTWLSLASFYRRRGRYTEMDEAIQKALQPQRKPSNILFDAASLLIRAGRRLPEAAQYLAKYLGAKDKAEEAPAFEAHYMLGQLLEKQGDKEAARREYQAALDLARDYKKARDALKRLR
jgi:tetratricopeptide (TPR) repeat protein